MLLDEEVRGRDEATKAMRRKAAGLPAGKTFASWREQDSSIRPRPVRLAALEWVHRAENLAISGPSGTGKTHFVEAPAHKVIDEGMRVSGSPRVPHRRDRAGGGRRHGQQGPGQDHPGRADRG